MLEVLDATYTSEDARNTLRSAGTWWRLLGHGRPAAYAALAEPLGWEAADAVAAALGEPVPPRSGAAADTLDQLGTVAVRSLAGVTWTPEQEAAARAALTGFLAAQRSVRDALAAGGALPPTATGAVAQLNVSGGGVPKRPVASAEIGPRGLAGDTQRHRQHHGRPWQAVCLWSAEVIDAFAAAGHPISYGAAGENVTVRGLPWAAVLPGVRLRVGEALLEVTVFSLPCTHNAQWFADRDYRHMHHERGPVSRVYAWVLEPGTVATGDPVVLEP
jgi:MOSC domain-containing protein YiiM